MSSTLFLSLSFSLSTPRRGVRVFSLFLALPIDPRVLDRRAHSIAPRLCFLALFLGFSDRLSPSLSLHWGKKKKRSDLEVISVRKSPPFRFSIAMFYANSIFLGFYWFSGLFFVAIWVVGVVITRLWFRIVVGALVGRCDWGFVWCFLIRLPCGFSCQFCVPRVVSLLIFSSFLLLNTMTYGSDGIDRIFFFFLKGRKRRGRKEGFCGHPGTKNLSFTGDYYFVASFASRLQCILL